MLAGIWGRQLASPTAFICHSLRVPKTLLWLGECPPGPGWMDMVSMELLPSSRGARGNVRNDHHPQKSLYLLQTQLGSLPGPDLLEISVL